MRLHPTPNDAQRGYHLYKETSLSHYGNTRPIDEGLGPTEHYDPPPTSMISQRLPPPPPAAEAGPSTLKNGYQTDYPRVTTVVRRPAPRSATTSSSTTSHGLPEVVVNDGIGHKAPPVEAYLLMRGHRAPGAGLGVLTEGTGREWKDWTYDLQVVQHPIRGKALSTEILRQEHPTLSPPLMVELNIRDESNSVIPVDHAILVRRLVHSTMMVELMTSDGTDTRQLIRVRDRSCFSPVKEGRRSNTFDMPLRKFPARAKNQCLRRLPAGSIDKTLLGNVYASHQRLTLDNRKRLFFSFPELIVRPTGTFTLRVRLLDLAGPAHIGTMIGITTPLATCLSDPFEVSSDWPGPVETTDISARFTREGKTSLRETETE